MDLLHLVDRLEELVASAQKMPIGSRAMIDRRRLLDIVDQMRVVIPQEVREAQELVARRAEIEREAEEEARLTVARAEEQAARLVAEHEIMATARDRAGELAAEADARLEQRIAEANADMQARLADSRRLAEQQMAEADEYAGDLLRRLQRQLRAFVSSVDAGLAQVEAVEPAAAGVGTGDADEEERPPAVTTAAVPAAVGMAAAPVPVPMPMPMPAPVLLRSDDGDPTDDAPLENLLVRPPSPLRGADAEVRGGEEVTPEGVIDDFALPGLDDEPVRGDPDAEETPNA